MAPVYGTEGFQKNFDVLKGDLEAMDRQIADVVSKASRRRVVFSHPVYQYFARRYGLNAGGVHWEPDELQPILCGRNSRSSWQNNSPSG